MGAPEGIRLFRPPPPERIDTPRLVLRWPRIDDAFRIAPLLNDWPVARWLANVPFPFSLEDGVNWVRMADGCRREGRVLVLLAARRGDDRPIGGLELNLERREAGYWIGTAHQGQGYGWETVSAVLRVAFSGYGLPDLTAATMPENTPSRRLLEKAGFVLRSTEPFDFGLRGGVMPGCIHTLTAERWRALNGDPA